MPLVVIPMIVLAVQGASSSHYDTVAEGLRVAPDYKPRRMNHTVVVLVGSVHRGVLEALAYAKSLAPNHLVAVTVVSDEEEQERIEKAWSERRHRRPARDRALAVPRARRGRSCASSTSSTPATRTTSSPSCCPSSSSTSWWGHLLHNQSALLLKGRLLFRKGTVVTSVPYHIIDADADGRNPAGDAEPSAPGLDLLVVQNLASPASNLTPSSLSKPDREALKAIYRLSRDGGAHTGALAERLGLTPGTVTATVKRLADRGLVDHKPYRGVELTAGRPPGRDRRHPPAPHRRALPRRHARLRLERGRPPRHRFEHELPQEVEDRLFVALDRPETCPHGFPIPAKETAELPEMPPLYALEPGDIAVVAVPGSTDPEIVAFLDTLGLRPGVRVEVKEKHPFDGPLVLRVDGNDRTLGATVANQVYVQKSA